MEFIFMNSSLVLMTVLPLI
jgi:hypothetical protein